MATKYDKYYQKTFNISTTMTSATFLLTYNLNYNFSLTDDDKLYYRVFFGLNDEEDNTYNGKLTFVPNSSEFMVTEGSKKIDNIKINLKNVDNTKTAAEIYITYSFNNLTDFLGKTYSIKYNNKTFLYLNFLMYKILVFSNQETPSTGYNENIFFVFASNNVQLPLSIPTEQISNKISDDNDILLFCDYFQGYFYYNADGYLYTQQDDENQLIYKNYADFMPTGESNYALMPKHCFSYNGIDYAVTDLLPNYRFYVYKYSENESSFFCEIDFDNINYKGEYYLFK